MRGFNHLLAVVLASVLISGCSAAYYATVSAGDGMYGEHDKTAIASRQRELVDQQQRQLINQIYAGTTSSEVNYSSVVADSYESAYARRLQGFRSPTYRLPSSYYDFRYGEAYSYASAYDPAFYNVMVSGDQVWVEPKYISSMFGTWGATNVTKAVGNWYYGWASPYYYNCGSWWGYPHYSWWDWNWNVCYNPYYSWWGYGWAPNWSYYHYHPHWGWGPGYYPPHHGVARPPHHNGHGSSGEPPRREQIVNRPSYTSPSSGKSYGGRQPARGTVNGSGVFDRGVSQGGSTTSRGTMGVRANTSTQPSRSTGSGSSTVNRSQSGRSSYFQYNNGRRDWDNQNGNSTSRNVDPWGNVGSRSSFGSGNSGSSGGSSSGSSSGGGHRGGNSLGR